MTVTRNQRVAHRTLSQNQNRKSMKVFVQQHKRLSSRISPWFVIICTSSGLFTPPSLSKLYWAVQDSTLVRKWGSQKHKSQRTFKWRMRCVIWLSWCLSWAPTLVTPISKQLKSIVSLKWWLASSANARSCKQYRLTNNNARTSSKTCFYSDSRPSRDSCPIASRRPRSRSCRCSCTLSLSERGNS